MLDEKEYTKLKKKLKEEYAQRLAALDVLFGKASAAHDHAAENGHKPEKVSTLAEAVRQILDKMPQKFSSQDIRQSLSKDFPSIKFHASTLSHFMKRLHENEGRLKLISKGKGKKPGIYEKSA